jgi:hypothetical protein
MLQQRLIDRIVLLNIISVIMEWGVNDTLKARAYGKKGDDDLKSVVSPLTANEDLEEPARDGKGQLDEWGTMMKHQAKCHQEQQVI